MAKKKKKQYVEEGIFSIYPDYPILIKENMVWEKEESPLHFHYYLEVSYCMEGKGVFASNNRSYEVEAGDVTIATANILHTAHGESEKKTVCTSMYIDLEDLLKLFPMGDAKASLSVINESLQDIYFLKGKDNTSVIWLVKEMIRLNSQKEQNYKAQTIGLLYTLVFKIYDIFSGDKGGGVLGGQLPVMPAIEYIYDHYMESIKG